MTPHQAFWKTPLTLLAVVAVVTVPVAWILLESLRGEPETLSLSAFHVAWGNGNRPIFALQFINSLWIAGSTTLLCLAVAAPAAYAMRGRQHPLYVFLLRSQMFPSILASIPLYALLDRIGLLGTRTGLILAYTGTALPFAILQLANAIESIPRDLHEAAHLDGAPESTVFRQIFLPLLRPHLVVTGLFAFMGAWNEFALAATFLSREELFTVPLRVASFASEYDLQLSPFAAASILSSAPAIALFYFASSALTTNQVEGAVKG